MHLAWHLALGGFCSSSLVVAQARAQAAGSDPAAERLETPYEEPAPAPAPSPPAAPPVGPSPVAPAALPPRAVGGASPAAPKADTRPLGPIRARRRLALTGELGWNGLAGFGPVLTYHAHPNVSLDLAAGVSLFGWKGGVRGRYNLLTTPFTPFVGVGFNATKGLGEVTIDASDDPHGSPMRDPVTIDLKPSYLVQGTLGFDFIHRRGFTMVGCIGYAWLLNEDNVDVLAGSLTEDDKMAIDVIFKSGAVISLALGYAFE
jgi:hypothetical protein